MIVKVIEVLAQSNKGFEDAIQTAYNEASKSIKNIKSIYVQDMQAVVENGRLDYRVNAKVSFGIDDGLRKAKK